MKKTVLTIILNTIVSWSYAQSWDITKTALRSFKPVFSQEIQLVDLDKDGDPDLIKTSLYDSIPVIWIDDDDDMESFDTEGDLDNDCLIIDRNTDGIFAGPGDLSIDWVDTDDDGRADMQAVIENSNPHIVNYWDWQSNYMWIIDKESDETFHYINWKDLVLRCWEHYGASDFYEDYHGQTLFQKAHVPSYRFSDPELNWENPFLFYDTDDDGLTEMTIRLEDKCAFIGDSLTEVDTKPTGKIDRAFFSFDLDNDNSPSNEFDFDMSIYFSGEGFDYTSHKHPVKNLRGLPDADSLFYDNRWRNMKELVYVDHNAAWFTVFEEGKWAECWFVFDEDDDCERWERVEFYQPKDPFVIGMNKGGIDNNPQADAAGDRGEWDLDNSGGGSLYIGFDGKIHLYGAEKGYWRIDQDAWSYQGWGGLYESRYVRDQKIPEKFATIRYEDTDGDGFFDKINYDLDGDTTYEMEFNLLDYHLKTSQTIIDTRVMDANGMNELFTKVAEDTWRNAINAVEAAKRLNVNYKWYGQMLHPKDKNQKYRFGYWLQFYLFNDLLALAEAKSNETLWNDIIKAYFSQSWELLK